MNVAVVRDTVKHYGIKGMKWDDKKLKRRTEKLEDIVDNTVTIATKKNGIFDRIIPDDQLDGLEERVKNEKETVDAEIKKAEAFLKKQKDIESSDALFKLLASDRKRKAVENYLKTLKVSSVTLSKLKKDMEKVPREKRKVRR